MKERITALISFFGSIGWGLYLLYGTAKHGIYDLDEFLTFFGLFAVSLSSVLYVIWTKFGKKEFSEWLDLLIATAAQRGVELETA